MANEFKYTLTFESLSTGTGAKVTADGVDAVAMATDRLNKKQAALNAEFSAVSDRFDVTRTAYYDLGAAVERTRKPLEKMPEANNQVRVSSRNTSMALLELSRGFEDAQYGIRGVLNNIPSLVLSLGGTAGLAGAISIGAVALSQIIPLFTSAGEKAVDFTDAINEAAAGAERLEAKRFSDAADAIDMAVESAAALNQQWTETKKAENDFSVAALSNAEKLAQAQRLIAEALGLQVDSFRELEAIAAREAQKRQQAADQAAKAELDRLNKAAEEKTRAADLFAEKERLLANEKSRLVALTAQRDALTEQEMKLKQIADRTFSIGEALTPDGSGGGFILPGSKTPEAQAAQKQLDNPVFQTQLEASRLKVAKLEENLLNLAKEVERKENAFNAATTQFQDIQGAVSTKLEEIQQNLAADTTLAQAQGLAKTAEAFATEIKSTFDGVKTNTDQGKKTAESLLELANDGKITADETAKAYQLLSKAIGLNQSHQEDFIGGVDKLLTMQEKLGVFAQNFGPRIAALEARLNDVQTR